ncbi:helix-turn-helix transcriptional regulator [Streptomyces sp. NPDC048172]|uniref:helix-turn-helix transcriptional regulator n=1 Tax=Streptomyces sp. NPDC048172 TaxID=3365505 RepID=UPI0037210546
MTTTGRTTAQDSSRARVQETMGIAAFLKSRRAALDPGTVGLPPAPNPRRVPGLRREEVAQLAGISVDYYIRIEQGRAQGISGSVLDAVARALRLDEDERAYLRNMAAPPFAEGPDGLPVVRPEIRRLLEAMGEAVPAFVVGPGLDYLAWNALGARIAFDMADLPPERRNAALLVFLHPESRALHPDWDAVAAETAAALRSEAGRHPCHPRVKGVVSELVSRSAEFRALWEDQEVREKMSGRKLIRHPEAGDLEVSYETFRLATDEAQTLCTYTADPGSPTEAALRRLSGSLNP